MGPHDNKNICTVKDAIIWIKKQPTEWEKFFTRYISDRKLVTRPQKLNNRKFSKDEIQVAEKLFLLIFKSLAIREM